VQVPKGILFQIKKLCFNCLWKGSLEYRVSHFAVGKSYLGQRIRVARASKTYQLLAGLWWLSCCGFS
jgi:hypothetical protein